MTTTAGTILFIGGLGKVASCIAKLCQEKQVSAIVASRSGKSPAGLRGVPFDWFDEDSYGRALEAAANETPVRAVFVVAPPIADSGALTNRFIDLAVGKGVARVVLLSASIYEEGARGAMGESHGHLKELGDKSGVEWAVLRPTWFQENFLTAPVKTGKIYSATGNGRIPWVSCDDIAAAAFVALTRPEPPNTDYLILGPELLSYQDLAETFTDVLGHTVEHVDLSAQELAARHASAGVPLEYAQILSQMDTSIKHGSEDRTNDVVFQLTGVHPKTFRAFVEANRAAWT